MLKSFTTSYKPLNNFNHFSDFKNKDKIIYVRIKNAVLTENPNNENEKEWLYRGNEYPAKYIEEENQKKLELTLPNGNKRKINFGTVDDFNKKFKIRTKGIFSSSTYFTVDQSISKKRSPSSSRRGGKKQKKYTRRRRR